MEAINPITCRTFVRATFASLRQISNSHQNSILTVFKQYVGLVLSFHLRNRFMERECHCRFLLLDFGHPMNMNTIKNVMNSMENVLALGSAVRRNDKEINVGISILNSDFSMFQSQSTLRKNYHVIIKRLEGFLKTLHTSSRTTVQEYKYLLGRSIEAVLIEFEKFKKCDTRCVIQIAMITKKTATVLADILKDVTSKLSQLNPNVRSVEKYKIVQIMSEDQEEIQEDPRKNSLIDCTSCFDDVHSLNSFLKDWLLNPQQQMRILLSKDSEFWVECDAYDCIIHPVSLMAEGDTDTFNQLSFTTSKGTPKPSYNLEVINRLPVNGLCPTLVFGIPRRLYATMSRALDWTQSQNNWKIFKQLCRELRQTRQGLLVKAVLPAESGCLSAFHFLTSDGDMLLLNDVSPDELYLPKWGASSQPDFCEDPNAAFVIRDCLKKIQFLDEYDTNTFSSGIVDHLRRYLRQVAESKKPFVPIFKTTEEKIAGKDSKTLPGTSLSHAGGSSMGGTCKGRRKKQKTSSGVKTENVHPALLAPSTVVKYRKVKSSVFNLPELDLNGTEAPK